MCVCVHVCMRYVAIIWLLMNQCIQLVINVKFASPTPHPPSLRSTSKEKKSMWSSWLLRVRSRLSSRLAVCMY